MAKAPRRVIVASFSSHVHRVQQVLDAAHANGRRVAFMGRSMVRNMTIAAELGYLRVPEGVLIDHKKAADLPEEKIVYMSTGSQGEPMAVLARMANLEHQIEVGKGDTVILASSLIPGNENAVYRVINGLTKLGATVVHKGNAKVHMSGHACAGELLYCYNIVRPKNVLPVHGEYRHLVANQALAIDTGVPEENSHHRRGWHGDRPEGRRRHGGWPARPRLRLRGRVHGRRDHRSGPQRPAHPRRGGLRLDLPGDRHQTGRVIVGPEIQARGFAEDEAVFDAVKPLIIKALENAATTAPATCTRSPRWCGAPSAAGSTARTAVAR